MFFAEPDRVIIVSGESLSTKSILLKWIQVSGSALSVAYDVTWDSPVGGGSASVTDVNQTTITGLKSNTKYNFQVQARNNYSTGELSLPYPAATRKNFLFGFLFVTYCIHNICLKTFSIICLITNQ